MADLEMRCDALKRASPTDEVFAKSSHKGAVEGRFPGQLLLPYKEWSRPDRLTPQ